MIMVGPGRAWRRFGRSSRSAAWPAREAGTGSSSASSAAPRISSTKTSSARRENGFLRLDVAFSRDQAEKVYVQNRMREAGRDIWAWLQDGAEFFVCGDKERMAADVTANCTRSRKPHGGLSPDAARTYVEGLKKTRRYKRDVY